MMMRRCKTIYHDGGHRITGGLLVLIFLLSARAIALPEAFPEVDLLSDSVPRYTALTLDDWGGVTAYILFDGNLETGYPRLYVWIPEHANYGTPVLLRADGDGFYQPLQYRVEKDGGEYSDIAWNIRWRYQLSRGSEPDYLTGEMIERERVRYVRFWFNLDFRRGQGNAPENQLHLIIPGYLHTTAEWGDVPDISAPRREPWNHLRVTVDVDRQVEGDQIILAMRARLWHRHHSRRVSVERMPEQFFNVDLSVSPYLNDPVYEEQLTFQTLLIHGVKLPVEPRWYSFVWDYEFPPWLGGSAQRGSDFMPVALIQ